VSYEHIFTAHAQTRLFMNFRSKICPRHSLLRPRFPIRQMHFHFRVTFTGYIWCFVLLRDLDLWPFDLESVSCTLYNFYAATMTIKGSLYWLEHPHVKAVFGRKKTKSSQNWLPKWRFFGNLRVQIQNIVIGTPKRHFLTRNDVICRILREYPSRGVGCSLIEEPKKRTKN